MLVSCKLVKNNNTLLKATLKLKRDAKHITTNQYESL